VEIRSGQIVLFYLFDVAETIDLRAAPALIGGPSAQARLAPKQATPSYVQYDKPPLTVDGETVGVGEIGGFRTRFRLYDYGVMSVALTRPFAGSWDELAAAAQTLIENDELEQQAERCCRSMVGRLQPALTGVRSHLLSEDYRCSSSTSWSGPPPPTRCSLPMATTSRPCCAASGSRSARRRRSTFSGSGSRTSPTTWW
jgi:hypothetical protein